MNRKLVSCPNKFWNSKTNTLKTLNRLKLKVMKAYRNIIKML